MSLVFRIYNNSGYSRNVSPIGDINITGKREEEEFYFNKSIDKITLKSPDYEDLIQFEGSFDRFFIDVYCDRNLIFKGSFTFLTADICKDDCQITLKIRDESKIACLKRNDKKINVLSAPITEVSSEIPELVNNLEFYMTVEFTGSVPPPVDPSSWGEYGYIAILFSGAENCCELYSFQVWAREVVTERCLAGNTNPPPGAVIIQNNCAIDGTYTYAKPYSGGNQLLSTVNFNGLGTYNCFKTTNDIVQPAVDHGSWTYINSFDLDVDCSGLGSSGCNNPDLNIDVNFFIDFDCLANNNPLTGNSIDHSRRVDDVFEYLAQETGCGVNCFESDFFSLPTNYVTGQANKLNNLFITEMSDVTRPFASGQATVLELSLFGFYKQMKEVFQLVLRVDEQTDCLEIEHVKRALENKVKLSELGELKSFKCCYELDLEKIPKSEEWGWNEAFNLDFVGRDIEYRDNQGQFLTETDPETHDVSEISTDIEYIYDAYDRPVNPVNNLEGFVITTNTFDGTNYILDSEAGEITGSTKLNAHLSQANLHENYWKCYRYYVEGFMNNNQEQFELPKALKSGDEIILQLCCDSFSNFDLDYKILDLSECSCGEAIIEEFNYNVKKKILTLKISII